VGEEMSDYVPSSTNDVSANGGSKRMKRSMDWLAPVVVPPKKAEKLKPTDDGSNQSQLASGSQQKSEDHEGKGPQQKRPAPSLKGWMNLTESADSPQWQAARRYMDIALGTYTWPPLYLFFWNGGDNNGLLVRQIMLAWL
jgi:hypothetical protein